MICSSNQAPDLFCSEYWFRPVPDHNIPTAPLCAVSNDMFLIICFYHFVTKWWRRQTIFVSLAFTTHLFTFAFAQLAVSFVQSNEQSKPQRICLRLFNRHSVFVSYYFLLAQRGCAAAQCCFWLIKWRYPALKSPPVECKNDGHLR